MQLFTSYNYILNITDDELNKNWDFNQFVVFMIKPIFLQTHSFASFEISEFNSSSWNFNLLKLDNTYF